MAVREKVFKRIQRESKIREKGIKNKREGNEL